MKYCKGNCGKMLGLLQGNYCENCKNRLPLGKKFIEDIRITENKSNGGTK